MNSSELSCSHPLFLTDSCLFLDPLTLAFKGEDISVRGFFIHEANADKN